MFVLLNYLAKDPVPRKGENHLVTSGFLICLSPNLELGRFMHWYLMVLLVRTMYYVYLSLLFL